MGIQLIWRSAIAAATGIVILSVAACEKEVPDSEPVVRPIKILEVQVGGAGRVQEYAGQIAAGNTADLGFEVPGRIVEFLVTEGQEVETGDVLARLDPADFQSQLNQADADYRAAESKYRRFEELATTGAVSQQALDQERRNYEVARAARVTAQKALADTNLRAPFSGNIGRTYVENFTNVAAKESVLLIHDIHNLEVVIAVPEQDWSQARPGRSFAETTAALNPVATMSTFRGMEFPLGFSEVATAADPVTRTFEIRLKLDHPEDVAVMPGMTASVRITVPDRSGVAGAPIRLPAAAVIGNDQGGSSVWLIDPQTMTVSETVVQLGEMSADGINVLSGIEPGDKVAISGVGQLREGMQVREYTR
jgi:RND family efflux transporter MFP subunit